ncbi:MAG: DUF5684 domain-containing protein [Phycisphaerales bacterium]|nr:DUF5684 domain-containing protein [Phycisphaerales bacterium]
MQDQGTSNEQDQSFNDIGSTPQMDDAMLESGAEAFALFSIGFLIPMLAIILVVIIGWWKMFNKAGIPGILAIIPIVNLFFVAQVGGKPAWWGLLCLLPFVGFIFMIIIYIGVAERFGRGVGTAVGLILLTPIFACILGFGSAKWTPAPGAAAA